jgi:hypothetical protein
LEKRNGPSAGVHAEAVNSSDAWGSRVRQCINKLPGWQWFRLCETLATSMIGENRPISLKVSGEGGSATSRQAESLGLIATELVLNSLKHAFSENTKDGQITVAFDVSRTDWKLSIADNGVGKPDGVFAQPKTGLGTGIVKALAQQLGAKVEPLACPEGTTVSVTHATFLAKLRLGFVFQSFNLLARTSAIGQERRPWETIPNRRSPHPPMPSLGSPKRRFAAPICTSSRGMCRRASPAGFLVTKASASSSRLEQR